MKTCFTTFACPDWSLRQIMRAATRHQYHGVELRLDAGHGHGIEAWTSLSERKKFRDQFEKGDLDLPCLATSLQFVAEDITAHAIERVRLASDVRAGALRVFFGPLPEGIPMHEAMRRALPQIREVAEAADTLNIQLWFETHDSLSRGADAAALILAIDRPNVGIAYNNIHPIRRGEPLEATIAHITPMIRHVHLHDGLARPDKVIITPMGLGQMPIEDTFKALTAAGYAGYLSGEWFNEQYGADPDTSLAAFHRDMTELARRNGVTLGE